MNLRCLSLACLLASATCRADVSVTIGHSAVSSSYRFPEVSAPAVNDAASTARFTLVDGRRDANGADLSALNDGRVPTDEDQPAENFFFAAGTDGGRIQIDLGEVISVKQVSTYSWHVSARAPQVYTLYGSDGLAAQFEPAPKRGTDPTQCGWTSIATVDTRPKGEGGQHGATIANGEANLGRFRYLLFDVTRTESQDSFGNTFYSEIDVVNADGPAIVLIPATDAPAFTKSFEAAGGKYQFTIDLTKAPDLAEWSEKQLQGVVQEWYPRIVAMLPSEGYSAPTKITLRFRTDMAGVPASAAGGTISLNARWFRGELKREAAGAVVHELVHVVQSYNRNRRLGRAGRPPGWLVEGIADYIRWFLYEPQSRGAEITPRNIDRARYDASYRITGNFLDWASREHDPEIVRKLNAAAREGRYDEKLWREFTGKSLSELGDDWKAHHIKRLAESR